MCDLVRQNLGVDVYAFRFSSVHVTGILAVIRTELDDRLRVSTRMSSPAETDSYATQEEENVLELRPNLWGIGVNLRALWRRWKGPNS